MSTLVRAAASITVRLPDIDTVPEAYRGREYEVRNLIGDGDSNPKLYKSNAASAEYLTFGLSLAPAKESGYQTCPKSTAGCRRSCLFKQGRGQCDGTAAARIAKTVAFFEEREWFERRLRRELQPAPKKARAVRKSVAFRPNVLSDIAWERQFPWMFEDFPEVTFYDYSRIPGRVEKFLKGEWPPNYHLTFSRGEKNEEDALRILGLGGNVSVVFPTSRHPSVWRGFPAVNGDETDLRFLDPPGHVIALRAKGTARHDRSGFVLPMVGADEEGGGECPAS